MSNRVRHPIFARMYQRIADEAERKGAGAHRDELLAGLSGRVIEVGAGTGLNFAHYPAAVTEVVAVEPEPYLRAAAVQATAEASIAVSIVDGTADELPAEAGEFDAGVASLVLCSVPSQQRALSELFRVIRASGQLRFYEHVRSDKPGFARLQSALDLVWPLVGGGCHTSRETENAIRDAGFIIERIRHFEFRPAICSAPVSPHVLGVAQRP
jgi:ubiquinone/menaquinone biosynthesis C-methylase UbiE